jgi:hypothetical protein
MSSVCMRRLFVFQEDRNQYPILQFCVPSSSFKVFPAQLHSSLQVSRSLVISKSTETHRSHRQEAGHHKHWNLW